MPYKSKTRGFAHQRKEHRDHRRTRNRAILWEMGTGKSKSVVDLAGDLHFGDLIDCVVVVSPSGLQRNWLAQFATHCGTKHIAALWESSMKVLERERLKLLMLDSPHLRVLCINYEALRNKRGPARDTLEDFIDGKRFLMILDESQRIKGGKKSDQAAACIAVGRAALYKRILSGTATPNSPVDLFPQFFFLDPQILGFSSITAFKAEYCQIASETHPMIMGMAQKLARVKGGDPKSHARALALRMNMIEKDEDTGRPIYRNLMQLRDKIMPHTSRVRKADCLDLPPKTYAQKITLDLSKQQRTIYNEVKRRIIAEFVHDKTLYTLDSELAIKKLSRLSQIMGNYFPDEMNPGKRIRIEEPKKNPRMIATRDLVEDCGNSSIIIYAWHTPEIDELCEVFKGDCVRIDGTVGSKNYYAISQRFCNRERGARILIAQVGAAIGWDGYAASHVLFYMNDFSLEHRLQSEDRAHRIGLKHPVDYHDLMALDTLDEKLIDSHRAKREMSEVIMGDPITDWI